MLSRFSLSAHRRLLQTMVRIVPVPVREDNYAYLLIDTHTNKAAVVDPFDTPKVLKAAQEQGVDIVACLTTHHHFDHSGGNQALANAIPNIPIYGGSKQGQAVNHIVKDNDEFTLSQDIHVKCLATPCHTQDSICYYITSPNTSPNAPGSVFTGDTLFIGGCGRFFEGTAAEMHAALSYLGTLPDDTVVYNGHEYTKGNWAFAKSVDGENQAVKDRLGGLVKEEKSTTGLTTIGDEKAWNPFMRLGVESIKNATGAATDVEVMEKLREMKNNYRG
ncbi:beta-lactamase-like protein [Cristinia sonorae]|uniref:hydroxyacylglutathione hydrolase n=1 Tax=Cristinia sonorae TaxID=1940300 RepID=A0A8K0V2N3_9AGAR|nr:beta-lactamase-like protein [Cristinia sonorae]